MNPPIYKTLLDYYIHHCHKKTRDENLKLDDFPFIDDTSTFEVGGPPKEILSFKDLKRKTWEGEIVRFAPNPLDQEEKEIGHFTLLQIEKPPAVVLSPGLVLEDEGVYHILIHHTSLQNPKDLAASRAVLFRELKDTGCQPKMVTRISPAAKILNPEGLEDNKHFLWQKHNDFRVWASLENLPFGDVVDSDAVIGCKTRFLCRGGSFLIVASSGIGKSTLMMQMAICWSANRDFFGLKPKKGLRCFLLQGENDDGDVAEMAHGIKDGLALTPTEDALLRKNFTMKSLFGMPPVTTFSDILSNLIKVHKPDVFFVDPLFAFLKGDLSSQEFGSENFRRLIDPVLKDSGCLLVATHHTPKPPRDPSRTGTIDLSYAGFGTSEMTNWFRAVATLRPEKSLPKTFRFIVAKRGARAGFPNGLNYCLMKHSEKGLFWEDVPSSPMMPSNGRPSKAERSARRLLKKLNLTEPLTRDKILAQIMHFAVCQPRQAANHWAMIKKHFIKVGKEYAFIPPEDVAFAPTLDSTGSFEPASSPTSKPTIQNAAPKIKITSLPQPEKPIKPRR